MGNACQPGLYGGFAQRAALAQMDEEHLQQGTRIGNGAAAAKGAQLPCLALPVLRQEGFNERPIFAQISGPLQCLMVLLHGCLLILNRNSEYIFGWIRVSDYGLAPE